jgi:uncharacterized protein (DUF2141 family)
MVLRSTLIFLGVAVLTGCAQVGFLTGGDVDYTAPEPVRCEPQNGSTLFSENRIQLFFDEYIQLNAPSENIFIVPGDAKLKCSIQKKVLTVEWQDPLKENTTYAIYFNNAIKDVTEDNSTLFSYVFSTGSTIDTLTTAVFIRDALSNSPVSDVFVGLYRAQDSLTPRYFAQSDKMGLAEFSYLTAGTYAVKAFKDENRDLKIGAAEIQGFVSDSVRISIEKRDTLMLSVFTPESEKMISKFEFKGPEAFELGLTSPMNEINLTLNGRTLAKEEYRKINALTYRLFPKDSVLQNNLLAVSEGEKVDSSVLRVTQSERSVPLMPVVLSSGILSPSSPIVLQFNSILKEVDTSKIILNKENDSISKIGFRVVVENDLLKIFPASSGKFLLKLDVGSIFGMSKFFSTSFEIRELKELGNLMVVPEGFESKLIVEVFKEKELIDSRFTSDPGPIQFQHLVPGEYKIRIILDSNGNGFWDTGNVSRLLQPEEIINYGTVRVRANWDISVPIKVGK